VRNHPAEIEHAEPEDDLDAAMNFATLDAS
jgi:hypothetical protein